MVILRSFISTSLIITAVVAVATPASGRAAPRCEARPVAHTAPKPWTAPLTRAVTVRAGEVTLKDALERIAAAAHLRFSYSAELLPLNKQVCATYEAAPLGDVLTDLLRGVSVEPVIAASDHVVLAPSTVHIAVSDEPAQSPVYPLLPIIATATSTNPSTKPVNYAFSLIDGREVERQGSVGEALNSTVPGVWAWQSPSGFTTMFSARGASSFGLSSPKVYIDGIEVANPLLMQQISPDNVERVEVIRGPEGAAMYGADALNGVTNIVTRHDWTGTGMPRLRVRSGLALSGSDYTGGPSVGQDHAIALQFGNRARSGIFNFGIGSQGAYMPGAYAHHVNGDGSFRIVSSRLMLTGTARIFSQAAGNPASLAVSAPVITPLTMQQYTGGLKAVFRQNDTWTHSVVVGVDGYKLGNAAHDSTAPLSAADSLLRAWDGGLRTTLRASSVAQLNAGDAARATLTFSAEHSGLHQYGAGVNALEYAGTNYSVVARHPYDPLEQHEHKSYADSASLSEAAAEGWYDQSRSSDGLSAQFDASLRDHFFLNGGVRLEHDHISGAANEGTAALPMLGGAILIGSPAGLSVKFRTAYGKAVRWPEMPRLDAAYQRVRMVRPILSPEQQSGIEAGVDVSVHQTVGIEVTRYDQTASGLSQLVALQYPTRTTQTTNTTNTSETPPQQWPLYALQAVGEIANKGWELQAYVNHGPLSLKANLALTDSRVQRVATGYSGDLQAGDRMLAIPARTVGVNAAWVAGTWSTSLSAARAFDWINYNRLALAGLSQQPVGAALRSYWQQYNGFTHLRATFTHNLTRELTLQLTGDNLLGRQVGEPDNLTVIPGRTISFGVRASF